MSERLAEAMAHFKAARLDDARELCEQALRQSPDHPGWLHLGGAIDCRQDRFPTGVERMERALAQGGASAELMCNLGVAYRTLGRFDAASDHFRRAIDIDASFARAYFDYSQTGRCDDDSRLLTQIETRLRDHDYSAADRSLLHFAAAKICDGLGRYDQAFVHYQLGNAAQGAQFDPYSHQRLIDRIIRSFSADLLRMPPLEGHESARPIFIVGMPRSGTTLLEQVLAAHPQVFAAGELLDIPAIAKTLPRHAPPDVQYPECVTSVPPEAFAGFAGSYLRRLDQIDSSGHTRVCDKNPVNYQHLGLLSLMLPNATVICCRRDPIDICVSCYFQKFAYGHEYTFDLGHVGFYYRQFERLMRYWSRVLPTPPMEVAHEDLVREPERVIHQVLDRCGLAFDQRCLRPDKADRAVRTASAWQVRNPISSAGLGRYKPYEPWLGPLRASLELFAT